jgi:N-acetylmuramoyl-L-alanine amidase
MSRQRTDFIIVHCAATGPDQDIGAREIDRWHRARGFLKIGYQFVIRRNGEVETGRELDEVGAHAEGYNSRSVGICLVGGVEADGKTPQDNFTHAQWSALTALLRDMKQRYPEAKIIGHREVSRKACPSFDVQAWLKTVDI